MPARLKSPGSRERTRPRAGPALTVHPGGQRDPPPPPTRLLKITRQEWADFWLDPISDVLNVAVDLPVVRRLFRLRDELERADRVYHKERVVDGSKGQLVEHPLGSAMRATMAVIQAIEDRLGLTPKARRQMGVQMGEPKLSLQDHAAAMNEALSADDEDDDPRLSRHA